MAASAAGHGWIVRHRWLSPSPVSPSLGRSLAHPVPAGWSTHTTVALLFHAQGLSLRPRPCGSTRYGPFSLKSASSDEQPDHHHHHHHQPPLSQQASQPVSCESGTWMYERALP